VNHSISNQQEALFGIVPETLQASFPGAKASFRDAAFACLLVMERGAAEQARPFVLEGGSLAASSEASVLDHAFWLWAAGEYLQRTDGAGMTDALKAKLLHSLTVVESGWRLPARHWLEERAEAVYLSHLAICYAGVQAAQLFADPERSMRLLKDIREMVFAKFIRDGRLISELGGDEVHADVITTAIPFGMLGIEDRILIEALAKIEEKLLGRGVRFREGDMYFGGCERPALTALIAWYYADKGETARAKALLDDMEAEKGDGGWAEVNLATAREPLYLAYWQERQPGGPAVSPFSGIVYELARRSLLKENANPGASAAAIRFVHRPTGYDDPYVVLPGERFPRHPEAGDEVSVHLITQPHRQDQIVHVHVEVNGREGDPIRMEPDTAANGEARWSARLGTFGAGDAVKYRFSARGTDSEPAEESAGYGFAVRTWQSFDRVRAVRRREGRVEVDFSPVSGEGLGLAASLRLETTDSGALRLSVRQERAAGREAATCTDCGDADACPDADETLLVQGVPLRLQVRDGKLKLHLGAETDPILTSIHMEGKSWLEALTDGDGALHKLRFNWASRPRDRWFGMGERYSAFEYSGRAIEQYVYNEYRDQGLRTYMPVPFAVGSGGCGLYLDSSLYSVFRFRSSLSDVVEIEADVPPADPGCTLYLFAGPPMNVVEQFATVVGKPELPPKWAFGPWMSSNNWDSQAEVLKQARLTREHDIPSTVLVIEQWSDEATFYIFNDALYEPKPGEEAFALGDFSFPNWGRWPDPKAMVDDLHAEGLKVLLWQIPIHKHLYGVAHPQRDLDEKAFLEKGYAVRNADGTPFTLPYNWFKDCHIVDFTNPQACEWWFAKRRYLVEEVGVDGFKTDGGEFVFGDDLQFWNGATGREMRNEYPNLYVGSYYQFLQKLAPQGGITFSRAGYTGAQRFPLHWAGDERSTFAAFRSSLTAGLTSGMSGIPFWGWDLAGFHGDIPSAELFVRSVQMAAFCPVMQYHAETKGEFNQDRTPWNIAERTGRPKVIRLYKRYADLRMNLLPYIYREAVASSRSGRPLMQAMLLAFPDDPHCLEMVDEYMFGDSLLVAPVIEEGASARNVYFPAGSWQSLFGPERFEGPALRRVPASLADIPVYVRQDRIIPLNLAGSLTLGSPVGNRVDRYEKLCFQLFVRERAELQFADDLGTALAIRAVRKDGELRLEWSGAAAYNLHFIVRGCRGVRVVRAAEAEAGAEDLAEVAGTAELAEVTGTAELAPGSFRQAGDDLILCVRPAAGAVRIVLA